MVEITCIICPNGCTLTVEREGDKWTVSGNLCPKGRKFAVEEMTSPKRSISSTVKTIYPELPRLSVRTQGEIPLEMIFPIMREINGVVVNHLLHCGDTILENVCGTGVNIISTSDMYLVLGGDR